MPSTTMLLKQELYQQATVQQHLPQPMLQQLSAHNSHAANLLADSSSSSPLSTPTSSNPGTPAPSAESLKRDLINQKVRAENRERKKRWREQNEDRNKDNDLRCRVHKRANKLFGKGDSDHKHRWVEEEFGKRQMKRKEKERRKQAVNGAIGANPSLANLTTANIITAHQQAQLSQLSAAQLAASSMVGVPHPNGGFYPMATNGMAPLSPTTTAKLLGGNLSAAMKKNAQHQFLQVTNGLLGADGGHLTLAPTSPTGTGAHIHHHHHHHLHIQDLASGKLPSPTSDGSDYSPLDHATHAGINGQGLQSMASGLSSSTGTSSGSPSPQLTHHQPQGQMQQNGQQGQTGQQGQGGNGQGGDYPMDAVLTLMQLNAGWVRQ